MLAGAGSLGLVPLSASGQRLRLSPPAPPQMAASVAEVEAAPPGAAALMFDGGFYLWMAGDFRRPPPGPIDGYHVIGHRGTSSGKGAWVRQGPVISVTACGARSGLDADPSANAVAFRRAISAATMTGLPLLLDGSTYVLNATDRVNFAGPDLRLLGNGSTLRYRGKGPAFVLDGGQAEGKYTEGMTIENLIIQGAAGVTDGLYARGIVRSAFRNIEVRDVSGKAFHLLHAVSCHFDGLKYSPPRDAPVTADHGLFIDNNGDPYYSANCVFTNAVMEDFPGTGCWLADASGMLFNGGTFEGCETGLVVAEPSADNVFVKLWFEVNRGTDALLAGSRNGFIGARFMSSCEGPNVRVEPQARGTWFEGGGYIRSVFIDEQSRGTSFHQIGVDENSVGTIGFQGRGPFTRIDCLRVDAENKISGEYEDRLGAVERIGTDGQWQPILRASRGKIETLGDLTEGAYQKIGRIVHAHCFIHVGQASAAGGDLRIDGLPFPTAKRQACTIHATHMASDFDGVLQARTNPNERSIYLSMFRRGNAEACASLISNETTLAVSVTYWVAE